MPANRLWATLCMWGCAAAAAAAAAGGETVLPEAAVTEQAIVDALRGSDDADPVVRTRGIRPVQRPAANPPAGAAPARASLLITFGVDSAELQPSARVALDMVARALQSQALASRSFVIEGHADPRGDEDRNQRLSLLRAQSVVDYLASAHGLATERLAAAGFGSSRLLNRSDPAAPENRRVTIVGR
jgi:outer membrane protein OmpA-like peptidoglycan-associated protein